MKEPREDDERLSALLEGRVEGRQREEMLAHLAAADDDYEVFTNTAAVLRALEEQDARPLAPPSTRRGGWRKPAFRTAMAVTGAVVLLLAVGLLFRGRGAWSEDVPLQLAMRADVDAEGLPGGWTDRTPWNRVRGTGAEGAENHARAVKAGAMLVDLSVAARARDADNVRLVALQMIDAFEPGANPGTPLPRIGTRPEAPVDSLNALLAKATERLADRLDRKSLELGAWLEAARLAAARRNSDFFQDGAGEGMLRRAGRAAPGDGRVEAATEAVRLALPRNGSADWDTLGDRIETLLSALVG